MNKIYKLVWSKVRNTWVVASEIAKGHGKSSSSEGNGKLLKSLVLTALLGSFMAAGTSPVAAALTPEQQAVYDAVMAQLKASGKVELGGKTGTNTGVAIGSLSEAPNQGTVAIGESAKGEFQSVAIGQDAQARWVDDTPNVSGNNIAIGASTRAYAANGIAQGNYASVYGTRGIAIGLQATVGEKPLTEQEYQEKVASGEISAADKKLYVRSEESNGNFVYRKLDTTGTDITKDHFNGIAIGSLAQSNAADSIALGSGAETYGDSSWATGYKAKAEGDYSMALGVQANSKKRLSVAIGGLANASEANAVAIGAGSQAKTSGGVAIGAASVADRAEGAIGYALGGDNSTIEKAFESAGLKDKYDQLKGITDPLQSEYNGLVRDYQTAARGSSEEAQAVKKLKKFAQQHADFMSAVEEKAKMVAAWKSAAGAVSIGDQENGKTRQLTGLAAGTKDTDAVNVAQLKVLDAKKADKNLNNITEEGQTVIKNLAKGAVVVAAGTNTTVQATEDAETGVKTYTVNVAADGQVTDGNAGIVTGGTVYNAIKDKADKSELTDIKVKYFSVNPEGTDLAKPADDIDNSNNDGAWAIRSMAIGPKARANQDASMAIGYGAETVESGSYGMAIGYEAKSLGQDALAGGYHAMSGNTGVAIGSNAKAAMRVLQKGGKEVYEAYEDAAVAVGNNAYARRSGSIAVGANSVANRWSIAVGQYSHSIGEESTAIGNMSHAYGDSSFAGGKRSGAYGGGSVAIGVQAKVGEAPITEEAFKKLQNAGTAMLADEFDKKRLADELTQEDITKYQGHLYVEQKEGGTTVYRRIEDPSGNMISYMKGVAIGAQTTVEGKQSVAIGAGANAKGKNSVTLGTGSAVDGTYSAAMGYVAKAAGDMSVAMGVQSNTSAKGAVAIGVKANSGGKYGAALGAFAEASALDSTALGSSATVTTNGGVALGANTVANVEAGKVGYAFAADGATLEQTIEAAGQKEKYDQLKAVINPLKDEYNGLVQAYQNAPSKSTEETQAKQALNTWIQGHGDFMKAVAEKTKLESTWQSGAGAVAVGNATNGKTRQITGVAAGSEDTDAVNVAQLKVVNKKVDDNTTKITGLEQNISNLQKGAGVHYFSVAENPADEANPDGTNWKGDGAKGVGSIAIGRKASTDGEWNMAAGFEANAKGKKSTAIGAKSSANGEETLVVGAFAKAEGLHATAIGAQSNAKGMASNAFGQYSKAEGLGATAFGFRAAATSEGGLALGPNTQVTAKFGTAIGLGAIAMQEEGVALGTQSLANRAPMTPGYNPAGEQWSDFQDYLTKTDQKDAYDRANEKLQAAKQALAPFDENHRNTPEAREAFAKYMQAGKELNDIFSTWAGAKGAISIGNESAGMTRQLTGLAAGTKDTDAVNVAQLKALNTKVDKGAIHYYSVTSDKKAAGSNFDNDGAKAADSMVIGIGSSSEAPNSTVLGNNNTLKRYNVDQNGSSSRNNIVVGQNMEVEGAHNAVFGTDYQNNLENRKTMVAGKHNTVIGVGNLAGYTAEKDPQNRFKWIYSKVENGSDSGNVVVGMNNTATRGSLVIGSESEATSSGVSVGNHNKVVSDEDFGVALGSDLVVDGYQALAIGSKSEAKADYTVAIGGGALAKKENSIAFGNEAKAQNNYSVAFGSFATATARSGVALGSSSLANREKGALGYLAEANTTSEAWKATRGAISIGNSDKKYTRQLTGLAAGTEDTDAVNVAQLRVLNKKVDKNTTDITELTTKIKNAGGVHYFSVKSDDKNASGGTNWDNDGATGEDAIAIGRKARAYGADGQSMGENAWSIGNYSQAWGYYALAGAEEGIDKAAYDALSEEEKKNYALRELRIGGEDKSLYYRTTFKEYTNDEFMALPEQERKDLQSKKGYGYHSGKKVWTPTPRAIAIGHLSKALGAATVAVGNLAEATGLQSTAIGTQANAAGEHSFAAGDRANAQKTGTVAIGMKTNASGEWSTAVGAFAEASGEWGTSLGLSAKAQSENGVALGASTLVDKKDAVSLGYKAKGKVESGVALGAYSVADREKGKIGYALGGDNSTLEKALESIGQKAKYDELTGKIDPLKDEYNGLMKAYQDAPANSAEETTAKQKLDAWIAGHPDFLPAVKEKQQMTGAWQSGNGAVSVGKAGATRQITNVAAGSEDTDAVNVAQLKVVNEKADKNAADITNLTKTVNDNGKATKVTVDGKEESTDGNLKITKKTKDGQTTYDLSLNDELTIGKDGKDGKIGINGKDGKSADITVGKGEAGVDGKDGITRIIYTDKGGKTHEVATLDDGLKFKGDNDDVVIRKLNTQLNITGGAKAEDLSDDNIGVVGTDGDNGGMTVKLSKKLKGLTSAEFVDGDNITNITGGNVTITRKEGNTTNKVDLWELNKTVNNITSGTTDVSSWKLQANGENDRTIKKNSIVNFTNGTATKVTVKGNDVTVDLNDATKKQIKDNTTDINNMKNDITNIQNTVNNIDTKIEQKIEGSKIKVEGDDKTGIKVKEDKVNGKVKGYKVSLDEKVKVGNVAIDGKDGKGEITGLTNTTVDATDFATKGRAATEEQLKAAMGKVQAQSRTTVKGSNNITVTPKTPNAAEYTVGLAKDISVDSVTAKKYKVGDKTYINDKGINANKNKITNVADGVVSKDSKDAVNGSQLFATNRQVLNNMNQINNLREESREGDALGAAMAALKPLDFDPYQRSQIMAGVGYYRGKEAVALGLAHYKNEDLMIHGGLAYAGNSELMANVGVSYRFGSSENREALKARNLRMPQYDKGPISSVYILQDEVDRLTKENKEANDRIAALEAKLEKVLEKVK